MISSFQGDISFQYKYVYLGSGDELQGRQIKRLTKSQKAFNGCLQQAYINDEKLIVSYYVATITSNARSGCRFTVRKQPPCDMYFCLYAA